MKKVYIYSLKDPRNNEIRYVGKTVNMENRYHAHTNIGGNKKNDLWISELKALGFLPIMDILEVSDEENWDEAEKYWIAYGRDNGWKLNNIADGGGGKSPEWCRDEKDLKSFTSYLDKDGAENFKKLPRAERIKRQKSAGLQVVPFLEMAIKGIISISSVKDKMKEYANKSV